MPRSTADLGSRISDLVPWELTGRHDRPVIAVLGGISADRHVTANAADPSAGWWQELVGPGAAVDTDEHRVLGIDWQVPSHGPITTHDQATALARVLDHLHLSHVSAIVGASYGGMVALAFAERFPHRVGRLAVLCAAHQPHPMATAHRVIQRRIIRLGFAAGMPSDGVALARALGITTYRTAEEFADRFDGPAEDHEGVLRFPVEGYLDHGGARYAARCTPERYLALSESIDSHHVEPERITTPTELLAVHGDAIAPVWQVRQLAARLGGPSRLVEIASHYGHDAFLKAVEPVGAFLRDSLDPRRRHAA